MMSRPASASSITAAAAAPARVSGPVPDVLNSGSAPETVAEPSEVAQVESPDGPQAPLPEAAPWEALVEDFDRAFQEATSQPARGDSPRSPGQVAGETAMLRELFAQIAADYALPVKRLMMELQRGPGSPEGRRACDSSLREIQRAAAVLDLHPVVQQLTDFRGTVLLLQTGPANRSQPELRDLILAKYSDLLGVLPEAFTFTQNPTTAETDSARTLTLSDGVIQNGSVIAAESVRLQFLGEMIINGGFLQAERKGTLHFVQARLRETVHHLLRGGTVSYQGKDSEIGLSGNLSSSGFGRVFFGGFTIEEEDAAFFTMTRSAPAHLAGQARIEGQLYNRGFLIVDNGTITLPGQEGAKRPGKGVLVNDRHGQIRDISRGYRLLTAPAAGRPPGEFENRGELIRDGVGTSMVATSFSNTGTVSVKQGSLVFTGSMKQLVDGVLTGGRWFVGDSARLRLGSGRAIRRTGVEAEICLAGSDSRFENLRCRENHQPFEFENEGSLELMRGARFVTSGRFVNRGTVALTEDSLLQVARLENEGGIMRVDGTLHLEEGGWIASGQLEGRGIVRVDNGNSLTVRELELRAADSGAALTLEGGFHLPLQARLSLEVGPSAPNLVVTGKARLGGTLILSLHPEWTPKAADSFTLISASGMEGHFENMELPRSPVAGHRLKIVQDDRALKLTVERKTLVTYLFPGLARFAVAGHGSPAVRQVRRPGRP